VNRLARIRQPWLFLLLWLGGGLIVYVASAERLERAVLGGLVFAVLITGWLWLRERIWRD
jgi:hypothetical protein